MAFNIKKILTYTGLVLISLYTSYFITLVIGLKDAKCADAQCAMVPHFTLHNYYISNDGGSNPTYVPYPIQHTVCGLKRLHIEGGDGLDNGSGNKSGCIAEDSWSGQWKLSMNNAGGDTWTACEWYCVTW